MPRSSAISVENNFTKGLITEATGLNFPENASTDTFNCVFSHTGEVSRRLGIDYEGSFNVQETDTEGNAIREFLWRAVAQNGEFTFLVLQIGNILNFFSMESTSLSPTQKAFTVDLDTFKVSGSPTVNDITCSFASGNGYLFVAHPYCSPFYISYDSDTDSITTTAVTLKIRDFEGVEDNLDVDTRPDTLSKEHHYNLINQGWGTITPETADNTTFLVMPLLYAWRYTFPFGIVPPAAAQSNYPSNADIWWTFKTVMRPTLDNDGNPVFASPVEAFSLVEVNSQKKGNTKAPRGHNVLTAWFQDRAAVPFFTPNPLSSLVDDGQGSLAGIPVVTSGYQRPNCVAFYAGRVWWAGINSEKFNTKIYFSRILEKNRDFGQCYQDNDPTGEDAADLLPSDGGFIIIPDIAKVIKMMQVGNAIFIFTTNGVWKIEGSQGIGFTATDYTVNKISSTPALSETSFVDVEGTPMWWNYDGIWAVQADQTGTSQVNSLTFTTIADFIDAVPSDNKRFVKGAYNPLEKKVQWVFRSTSASSIKEDYQYDRLLNLSLINQAFYPWSLEDNCNKIVGLFVLQGVSAASSPESLLSNSGATITSGIDPVTVNVVTRADISSIFKYITTSDCFVNPGETTVTYNQDFLGQLAYGTFGNGPAAMQNGIIVGEDGEYYSQAFTGSSNYAELQRFSGTGTIVAYTNNAVKADVQTELGHTFDSFTTNGNERLIIPVPYTQYFYYLLGAKDNVGDPNFGTGYAVFALYKINGSGNITFQAAKAYSGSIFVVPGLPAMTVHAVDFKGEPKADPLTQQVMFVLTASGSIIFLGQSSVVVELPSVNDFIADSGTLTGTWASLWNPTNTGEFSIYNRYSSNGYTRVNSAFFLPVNNSGVWDNLLCVYLSKGEVDYQIANPTSSTTLHTFAVDNPDGFVIVKSITGDANWTLFNSHFKAEDNSDLIPFADVGLNKDASVGDSTYNDWDTPSVQHDATSGLSLITWGRHYKDISINMGTEGSYAKALVQSWDPIAQAAQFVKEVEGSPWISLTDFGLTSSPAYAYTYGLFFFLSPDRTKMYVYTRDDGAFNGGTFASAHYALAQFANVTLNLTPATTGLTFSEFINDSYLDWQASGESEDFTSYFITGYKVHGDAIRKFQNNYIQLYTNNDVFSRFDFQNRWDYSISGDTGRWSNGQRITMDDSNYKYRSRRLKTRGHGKALQYKVTSVSGEPFNIIGWSTWETGNSNA